MGEELPCDVEVFRMGEEVAEYKGVKGAQAINRIINSSAKLHAQWRHPRGYRLPRLELLLSFAVQHRPVWQRDCVSLRLGGRSRVSFPVSKEAQDKDFVIEFDKAKVMMPGTNVTVVAFSRTVGEALMPLLKRERTPNDQPHCFHQKGWGQSGIGFEIVGIIMEMEAFDYLDNNPLSA
ncbi:hypothetical protein F441_19289 [Phytophthora nicotianae CJ01A1]|nr:hypothetical protein F441_19289 [Phytophthora nicotianae CJ01A1]